MLDAAPTAPRALGEILAAGSALAWAVAVILFRISGRRVHPVGLNLAKTVLALAAMAPTLALLGEPFLPDVPGRTIGLLLFSGVLGIAISDTLFFYALNRLGASLTAVVDCLYAPFVIGFSFLLLGERLSPVQLAGAGLVVSAILTLSKEGKIERIGRRDLVLGILYGALAMFSVALGIVIVKPVLGGIPVFWATSVRLVGGALALAALIPFLRGRRAILAPLFEPRNWKALVPASFFGSYLSLVLWMGGMKFAKASVAAVLNQLSTIFIVVIAALFLKERMTAWKALAVALALAGACLASWPF
ncbi:MAG TPA: DMT family transporter [Candidatus Aminicenantes bacterium]|nr:DMT family transporter [Candidatus Aminicenantes bacterium]HRY65794.1 DMT family transporter [Candidatus Aminicenantes bacterium]HRZ72708.1 DMT family transporter [Candidatus Aminicenantes bacterium]